MPKPPLPTMRSDLRVEKPLPRLELIEWTDIARARITHALAQRAADLDSITPAERKAGQLSLLTNLGAADD